MTEKESPLPPEWFVYLIACGDGSLYCGIAKQVEKRFLAHLRGRGARYTRGRAPLELVWSTSQPLCHGDALRLELAIKALPTHRKLAWAKAWEPAR